MKSFSAIFLHYLRKRASRGNLKVLVQLVIVLALMVTVYSIVFHYLMAREGRQYSWITGVYWILTIMSTLGLGDITFHSDVGRMFSTIVLLSGMLFMLILLPFTFIQFFYAPWMEAQAEARAPRRLPEDAHGHVVLTQYGPVEAALVKKLVQYHYSYAILVPDVIEALRLYDLDLKVVVGEVDDPETYRRLRLEQAALVATMQSDAVNTNVAFTVQEVCDRVPIVATAANPASVDILELAGCMRVLELAQMTGQALARRVIGRDAKAHVIGRFGELLIAEASAANTPLVGRTLREIRLRDHVNVTVAGIWERGRFEVPTPETRITAKTVLVLAGSRSQLDDYDALFCIYHLSDEPVVIIGGGRVGLATANALAREGIACCILEKSRARAAETGTYVFGDAADLATLEKAGIRRTPAVVVTTRDDDLNVYLTLYCRRLRPDIQIISRATLDRTVVTLHRAGADFVISEASMGANTVFNLLQRSDILLLAEGLDVFKVKVPSALADKTVLQSGIREQTGCSVIGIRAGGTVQINPDPHLPIPPDAEMILIGSTESEQQFLNRYIQRGYGKPA